MRLTTGELALFAPAAVLAASALSVWTQRLTTKRTLESQRQLAQDERSWQERRKLYVEILLWLQREEDGLTDLEELRVLQLPAEPPREIQARMSAFASLAVFAATNKFFSKLTAASKVVNDLLDGHIEYQEERIRELENQRDELRAQGAVELNPKWSELQRLRAGLDRDLKDGDPHKETAEDLRQWVERSSDAAQQVLRLQAAATEARKSATEVSVLMRTELGLTQ